MYKVGSDSLICAYLWHAEGGVHAHRTQPTTWFGYNDTRQCSYVYGVEAVKQFLKDNKLTSLIRAHEAQIDG